IRLEVAHLSRPTTTPQPLWCWWWGPIPPDLAEVWQAYQAYQAYVARYTIEHSFRFFKQTLKRTTPELRQPEVADPWTGLLPLARVQLRWGRDRVADVCLAWQRPPLLAQRGSPANVPKPRGRSPGTAQRQAVPTGPAVSGDQTVALSRSSHQQGS